MLALISKLALRNIFRNTRRTLLTGLLIGVGLAALMVTDGLIRGMRTTMIQNATDTLLGHAQIHHPEFRRSRAVEDVVRDIPAVEAALAKAEASGEITVASRRVIAAGMLSSPRSFSGVAVLGVDPEAEAKVSKIRRALRTGEYLRPGQDLDILIGQALAEDLEVGLGDRVVVTTARAGTGDIGQELFRVSGIFRFSSREIDQGMVFVQRSKAEALIGLPGAYHEVALRTAQSPTHIATDTPLFAAAKASGNEILPWPDLVPALKAMLEMSNYSLLIMAVILFGVVVLGVVNSLFMAIYERMFEFGVLRSLGTHRQEIFSMILLEAFWIGVLSLGIGAGLGTGVMAWFAHAGIRYDNVEFSGVTLSDPIFPEFHWVQFTWIPISVLGLVVVTAIYPALHAARILPSEAMRKSL